MSDPVPLLDGGGGDGEGNLHKVLKLGPKPHEECRRADLVEQSCFTTYIGRF